MPNGIGFGGGGGAPSNIPYITAIPDATLTAEQALSLLSTGILKNTSGTLSTAVGGDLPSHNHAASEITSGTLALARGGLNADISGGGGATNFLRQAADHSISSGTIAAADIATALTTSTLPSHVHAASDITSGTLDVARIPSLPASQITSGQLALARGGTGVDLSAGGGSGFVLKQAAGGVISSAALIAGDIPSLPASQITSGQLALARGGTGVDLSAGGGANFVMKQAAGGVITSALILSADLTSALTTPPAIGGTTPAALTGTVVTGATGIFTTSVKTPIIIPTADSTTAVRITKADGSTNVGVWDTTNSRLGIGVTPSTPIHAVVADANTASVVPMITLAHNLSSGTAAAGIGVGIEFYSHTSGTGAVANTAVGKIEAKFGTTNHTTRNGTITIYANVAGTATPIIAASGGTAGYGALAFFGQAGQNAWNYVSKGIAPVSTFSTGAVDPTAARKVDLNTLGTAYNNLESQVVDIINMLLGYGLWFVQD